MKTKTKNIISIDDSKKGFCKVTYGGGLFEYIREEVTPKLSKKSKPALALDNSENEDDLAKLNKSDLVEIAQKLGFENDITKEVTKAILIDFINENKDK